MNSYIYTIERREDGNRFISTRIVTKPLTDELRESYAWSAKQNNCIINVYHNDSLIFSTKS